MKLKALAVGALCAIAVGFLGCADSNSKKDQGDKKDQDKVTSTTKVDQSDPLVVAKAWATASTEGDLDGVLALTDEDSREKLKKEFESPYTPPPWRTNDNQRADAPKTRLDNWVRQYKGKPIDVLGEDDKPNGPAKIFEKNGKKFAEVCVVYAGIHSKEANGNTVKLILKDGKWFVTTNHD